MQVFKDENIANPREFFKTNLVCREYLSRIKWGDFYICKECSWRKCHTLPKSLNRVCNSCGDLESPTKETIFFNLRFKLPVAFSIVIDVLEGVEEVSPGVIAKRYRLTKRPVEKFINKLNAAIEKGGEKHLFLRVE